MTQPSAPPLEPWRTRPLWAALFCFNFLASPYWLIFPGAGSRAAYAALVLGLGWLWAWLAAGTARWRPTGESLAWLGLALLFCLAFNWLALTGGLAWRGDEDFHVHRSLSLALRLGPLGALVLLAGGGILGWACLSGRRWGFWLALLGCLGLAAVAVLAPVGLDAPHGQYALRYPFLPVWMHALLPALFAPWGGLYQEVLHRFWPLASAALLAWACARRLRAPLGRWALLVIPAAATLPAIWYYSSVLYLEMPIAMLGTVICLEAEALLAAPRREAMASPGWPALLLIGFCKETVLFFIGLWAIARGLGTLPRLYREPGRWRLIWDEALLYLGVFLPMGLYMWLRALAKVDRGYVPTLENLSVPQVHTAILVGYWEQWGLWAALALAAVGWLCWRGRWRRALFLALLVVGIPYLHAADTWNLAGYSRFNLLAVPAALAGGVWLLELAARRSRALAVAIILGILAVNLWLAPVYPDGSKVPFWGNRLTDTSEHYYPWPRALAWLKERHPNQRFVMGNGNWPYFHEFYLDRLDWHPQIWLEGRERFQPGLYLWRAMRRVGLTHDYPILVYPIQDIGQPAPPAPPGHHLATVIANQAHAIAIYVRDGLEPGAPPLPPVDQVRQRMMSRH